jgi:hypothetical protein
MTTDTTIGKYILYNGRSMNESEKRQADALEIEFTPEMYAVGERLMAAWDDPDPDYDQVIGTYPAFLERLFREVLGRHNPPVGLVMKFHG